MSRTNALIAALAVATSALTSLTVVWPRDDGFLTALQQERLNCGSVVEPEDLTMAGVDVGDLFECPDARSGQVFLAADAIVMGGFAILAALARRRSRVVLTTTLAVLSAIASIAVAIGQNPPAIAAIAFSLAVMAFCARRLRARSET